MTLHLSVHYFTLSRVSSKVCDHSYVYDLSYQSATKPTQPLHPTMGSATGSGHTSHREQHNRLGLPMYWH